MKPQKALKTIFVLSIAGLLFSGYLSYQELFLGGCQNGLIKCGSNFSLIGLPACVYGFVMYAVIFVVTLLGMKSGEKK